MSERHLVMATDGPCAGHPCDACAICRSGTCCRRDHPDYRLPEEGDWDGPYYGDLGVLLQDGDQVQCHGCGEWKRSLVQHVRLRHQLTVAEYRAVFGLNVTQPLVADRLAQTFRERLLARIADGDFVAAVATPTPEQMSRAHAGRVQRRQAKGNSRRALREHFGTQGSDTTQTCRRCGTNFRADHASRRVVCSAPECVRWSKLQALAVAWERWDADTYRWRDGVPPAVRLGVPSKLTDAQWQEAMALRRDDHLTYLAIARRYGISKNNLRRGLLRRGERMMEGDGR